MKINLLTVSLLSACVILHAQPWVRQNPLPVGLSTDIFDICAIGPDTVYVLGEFSEMGKSVDGGQTWTGIYTGVSVNLRACSFLNGRMGWAVGGEGVIVATGDGGLTWTEQGGAVRYDLHDVQFLDANVGYAAGDTASLLKTSDGGANWNPLAFSGSNNLNAVFFLNPDTGWIAGTGVVARTYDGGANWEVQNTGGTYRDVFFLNPDSGWACMGNRIYRTLDGGADWNILANFSLSDLIWSERIRFYSANNGWLVGSRQVSGTNFDGVVLHSTDAGATWTRLTAFNEYLLTMSLYDSNAVWCAGTSGRIARTTDGGTTWESKSQGPTGVLRDVFFASRNQGWAVGGSGFDSTLVLHSANGGNTWTPQQTPIKNSGLEAVFFVDTLTGWAVGQNMTIMQTTDGGMNWTAQGGGGGTNLQSVFFLDRSNGWVVGGSSLQSAVMQKTTDAGGNWTTVAVPVTSPLNDAFFLNPLVGWVVGSRGTILKTTNGGITWDTQSDSALGILDNVYFSDSNTGWIVGSAGIYTTVDGGLSRQLSGNIPGVLAAHYVDASTVYAVTGNNTTPFPGYIYRTTDAGETWERRFLANGFIWDAGIFFLDDSTGWVVSQGGTILHTYIAGGPDWTGVRDFSEGNSQAIGRRPVPDIYSITIPTGIRFVVNNIRPAQFEFFVYGPSGRLLWTQIGRGDADGRCSLSWPRGQYAKGCYFIRLMQNDMQWKESLVLFK